MIIYVKVKPDSRKEEIVRINDNNFVVSLKERAEDGKANKRLVNLIAKEFGVSFREVRVKNPKGRNKIVEILV